MLYFPDGSVIPPVTTLPSAVANDTVAYSKGMLVSASITVPVITTSGRSPPGRCATVIKENDSNKRVIRFFIRLKVWFSN